MTKIYNRFLAAVLAVASVLFLFSCGGKLPENSKIVINDEKTAFSSQTEEKSKSVIFSLLESIYISGGMTKLPESTKEKLEKISDQVWQITTDYAISESKYNKIIEEIEKNGESFTAVLSGDGIGVAELRAVYYSLTSGAGPDYAGYALYNLLLFGMDYKYEEQMERYEKYGYLYLLEEAEAIKENKSAFESQIGLDNFSLAIRVLIMGSELFFGGAVDGSAASFSSREILTMLKRIDLADVNLNFDGYKLLISLFVPDSVNEKSAFSDRVLFSLAKNEGVDKLAESADTLMRLLASVQEKLSDEDAEHLKNSEIKDLISSVFSKFDSEDWSSLEKMAKTEIDYTECEGLFSEAYGEDFVAYSESVTNNIDLDDLKKSVGGEDFLEKLEGYLAGISPVLTYRIFK